MYRRHLHPRADKIILTWTPHKHPTNTKATTTQGKNTIASVSLLECPGFTTTTELPQDNEPEETTECTECKEKFATSTVSDAEMEAYFKQYGGGHRHK